MQSDEIRSRFLKFFENNKRNKHKIIPSASLVPENDPSVLFNTAGMQPLVPYLLGEVHPAGKCLVNIQKCVRTQDIDEVGDNTHDTFFEMMGNWSLGDYFKEEAIKWSYEFLTSKDEGLGLDPKRLYVTVFEGDENAPKDTEAFGIWKKYISENHIYYMDAKTNWWSVGDNGPCGPDTEMFYDITADGLGDLTKEEYIKADSEQKVIEIWNDVFLEYEKRDGKVFGKLKQRNVDTGAGLERVAMAVQGKNNIFDTDLFGAVMEFIKNTAKNYDEKNARIAADHIRTSIFLISDGVLPSNKNQGYILRRLIRRAVLKINKLNLTSDFVKKSVEIFIEKYKNSYSNILQNDKMIFDVISTEENKFKKTLERGLKQFNNNIIETYLNGVLTDKTLRPDIVFSLYTSDGFPIELITEIAKENGLDVDLEVFKQDMEEHKKLSRTGATGMFKGGLAN